MNISLLDILLLVSLSQGFIFGLVVLFTGFFKGPTNKYLAYSIFLVSLIGLAEFLSFWNFDDRFYLIDLLGDDVPWILLFYVPLFIYFLRSAGHPLGHSPKKKLLYLPFFIFLLLNLLINMQVDFHWFSLPAIESFMLITYNTEYYLALAYSVMLCCLAFFIIRNSELKGTNRKWLTRIWIFTSALILCWLAIVLQFGQLGPEPNQYLWIGISIFIYWLTYQGLYRFQLLKDQSAIQSLLQQKKSASKDPLNPNRGNDTVNTDPHTQAKMYVNRLAELMENEYLYRDPDLSRDVVANRLGISPGYLSQLISTVSETNFSAFINHFRVEEVKKMIQDPDFNQYSLLAIGMEAGFRSKSAFYTTFKKVTGMTPSDFKKQSKKVRIS